MKIRNDFVTNSSSSSFILAFKDRDSVQKELYNDWLIECLEEEGVDRLIDQIIEGELNLEKAIEEFKEDIIWEVIFDVEDEIESEVRLYLLGQYEHDHKDEVEAKVNDEVNKQAERLRQKLQGKGFISRIEISDHTNPDLEHEIMPSLDCCISRVSHH